MGLLDKINELQLSDEDKEILRQEYSQESGQTQQELETLRRRSRREAVENEVNAIGALFASDNTDNDSQPLRPKPVGLMKYVRRVLLSDDEQPGTVLLSDDDLELSDDERIGARSRQEVSTADVVREVFNLMPKDDSGKLLGFGDIAHEEDDHSRGSTEDEDDKKDNSAGRSRVEAAIGRPIERKRTRFKGSVS